MTLTKLESKRPKTSSTWQTMVRSIFLLALGFLFGSSVQLLKGVYIDHMDINLAPTDPQQMETAQSTSEECYEKYLPKWVRGDPEIMAQEFEVGSQGLSDKYDDSHRFFYAYQPYLSKLVLQKLKSSTVCSGGPKPKIKFMEIGLGCHWREKGIKGGNPGGSAMGWRALFNELAPVLDLELHLLEYDAECITKWHKTNPDVASMIHTGDASDEADLARVVQETGSMNDFDVIIDDASHINWHMIKTFEVMIEQIQLGGLFFVEDIWSSCKSWKANMGTKAGEMTGGTADCLFTKTGDPTFFFKVVEWQRALLIKKVPFKDLNHIDFHGQIVVFEKQLPQVANMWIDKSS